MQYEILPQNHLAGVLPLGLSRLDVCYKPRPRDKATCAPTSQTTSRCKSLSMTRCYHNLPVETSMRGVRHRQERNYIHPGQSVDVRVFLVTRLFPQCRGYSCLPRTSQVAGSRQGGRHEMHLLLNNIPTGAYHNHRRCRMRNNVRVLLSVALIRIISRWYQMPTILTSLCVRLMRKLIRYLDMQSSRWPVRQLRRTKNGEGYTVYILQGSLWRNRILDTTRAPEDIHL